MPDNSTTWDHERTSDQPLVWSVLDMLAETVYRDNLPNERYQDMVDDVRTWARTRANQTIA